MNKTLKLSVFAAACAAVTFSPVSMAHAEELLVDNSNILISEYNIGRDDVVLMEDVLLDAPAGDEILIYDAGTDIGNAEQDIIIDSGRYYGSGSAVIDVYGSGKSEDILLPDPTEGEPLIIQDTSVQYNLVDKSVPAGGDQLKVQSASSNTTANKSTVKNTASSAGSTSAAKTQPANTSSAGSGAKTSANAAGSTGNTGSTGSVSTAASVKSSGSQSSAGTDTSVQTGNKTGVTDQMNRLLKAVNEKRRSAGVGELTFKDDLNHVASLRAKEASKNYSHTRAGGKNWVTILSQNGVSYNCAGENLACYMSSPEQVVTAWSMSPSHNRCMTNGEYTHAGVGTVTVNGCVYWVLTLTD